jgi:hypothetical protein
VSVVRTTSVRVYVGDVLVGAGELVYYDVVEHAVIPHTVSHCDETPVYVDDEAVSLWLCWDDVVTGVFAGTTRRVLEVPVYIGDVLAGRAVIELLDSHGSALSFILYMAVILFVARFISVLIALYERERKKSERENK